MRPSERRAAELVQLGEHHRYALGKWICIGGKPSFGGSIVDNGAQELAWLRTTIAAAMRKHARAQVRAAFRREVRTLRALAQYDIDMSTEHEGALGRTTILGEPDPIRMARARDSNALADMLECQVKEGRYK